ncbi:right-handed parallel beta-helix repeat-containing protein [Edaphobacter bradus]|uniref:right-handed parallel beta-helix repeat-containing protein n=1 Tax=Edaphobacter bradus TaxID=2259016 RepID=UPI0021DF867D|nr:right-handed parallel beta-helix repeat-containing protein [Edaphobacter bradus]
MISARPARLFFFLIASVLPVSFGQTAAPPSNSAGHEYFVDCSSSGNGSGESPASPWNSLDSLQSKVFSPGDVIRLRRGTECRGSLWPKGSGSADHPARLTAYGEGSRPKIFAGDKPTQAFKLFNQEYWDIDSLDLSGGTTFGIFISGDKGILHHIHLTNLLVHGVLGGDLKSKDSGLVVISPGTVNQWFDDVLVDGVTAYNTKQWAGIMVGGGNLGFTPENTWSTHVIIRNSIVHDVQGDGIVLFRVRNGLIDSTVAWRTGMQQTESTGTPNAIWTWMCHDCIVSHSEAFLTDSPGVDGGAFDIDYGNTNNSLLDSFGHDTQGYCVAVFGAGFVTRTSVVRGNVCIDNGRSPRMSAYQSAIFLHTWNGGSIDGLVVENNTVYWNPLGADPPLINDATIQGGEAVFKHNAIYSTSPAFVESNRALSLNSNHYFYYGAQPERWQYGSATFDTFKNYQRSTGQDSESSLQQVSMADANEQWFRVAASAPVSIAKSPSLPITGTDYEGKTVALKDGSGHWRINCWLPAKLNADGLLDASVSQQLTILKSISLQFPASKLKIVVVMRAVPQTEIASLRTAIRDLQMNNVTFLIEPTPSTDSIDKAQVILSSPDGKVRGAWDGFAGPTDIGFAVRKELRTPVYPQMETSKNE